MKNVMTELLISLIALTAFAQTAKQNTQIEIEHQPSAEAARTKTVKGFDWRGRERSCEPREIAEGERVPYLRGMKKCAESGYTVVFCKSGTQLCSEKISK